MCARSDWYLTMSQTFLGDQSDQLSLDHQTNSLSRTTNPPSRSKARWHRKSWLSDPGKFHLRVSLQDRAQRGNWAYQEQLLSLPDQNVMRQSLEIGFSCLRKFYDTLSLEDRPQRRIFQRGFWDYQGYLVGCWPCTSCVIIDKNNCGELFNNKLVLLKHKWFPKKEEEILMANFEKNSQTGAKYWALLHWSLKVPQSQIGLFGLFHINTKKVPDHVKGVVVLHPSLPCVGRQLA